MTNRNIWFALVLVQPINGNTNLGNAAGAYVNVAYRASDKDDFLIIMVEHFKSFDFEVIEVEDIENQITDQQANHTVAEKKILLERINHDGDEFAWGKFHTYPVNE